MNKYFSYFILLLLTKNLRYYFFERELEFSGAVFTLFLLILMDRRINFLKIMGLFAGIFFIDILGVSWGLLGNPIERALNMALPAIFYYFAFLTGCILIDIKRYEHGRRMVILLVMDFICNFLELMVKGTLHQPLVNYMIVAIIIRGVIVYMIFLAYKKKEVLIVQEEHNEKYIKLNLMASDLEAESFYLKKISANVEGLMKKAYTSYKTVSEVEEAKRYFLDLSREIHELKKDYTRVVLGLDNLFRKFEHDEVISLTKVGDIIRSNTKRYLLETNLDIQFRVKFKDDFKVRYYHKIFIVINNLVINAIEAMAEESSRSVAKVEVCQHSDEEYIYIRVWDNGPGVSEDFLSLIFIPGFTTKFSGETGRSSTGMGLSHVRNIVDEAGGVVEVFSTREEGTRFEVRLPLNKFRGDTCEKEDNYN